MQIRRMQVQVDNSSRCSIFRHVIREALEVLEVVEEQGVLASGAEDGGGGGSEHGGGDGGGGDGGGGEEGV